MTVDQQLLLHIYANQKIFMMRILEMTCAIKEFQESGKEPTGLLAGLLMGEIEEDVKNLVEKLTEKIPDNIAFGTIHGVTAEQVFEWLDSVEFTSDEGEEE